MKSQKQLILEHMQEGKPINKFLAWQLFSCMTLAQRIDDIDEELKSGKLGAWKLLRRQVPEHNNASEYWMITTGLYNKIKNYTSDPNVIEEISWRIIKLQKIPNCTIEQLIRLILYKLKKEKKAVADLFESK